MNSQIQELLHSYLSQKIDTLMAILLELQKQLEEENEKDEEKRNYQLVYTVQGKQQAYYSLIKSLRSERDSIELMNDTSDPNTPKLKGNS